MSSQVQLSKEDIEDLEFLRALKRASQGLPITEQDIMTFLVNANDPRERSRLSEPNCYVYSGWEDLAEIHPETFGFLVPWAIRECIYFIPQDGLQRQEAILMTKAKSQGATPLTIENITNPVENPTAQVQQVQQQPKGRSLLHPLRHG